jgi:hypothetical protein
MIDVRMIVLPLCTSVDVNVIVVGICEIAEVLGTTLPSSVSV